MDAAKEIRRVMGGNSNEDIVESVPYTQPTQGHRLLKAEKEVKMLIGPSSGLAFSC
jgi:hypothetical protein